MVVSEEFSSTLPFPWSIVSASMWVRYPNDMQKAVLNVEASAFFRWIPISTAFFATRPLLGARSTIGRGEGLAVHNSIAHFDRNSWHAAYVDAEGPRASPMRHRTLIPVLLRRFPSLRAQLSAKSKMFTYTIENSVVDAKGRRMHLEECGGARRFDSRGWMCLLPALGESQLLPLMGGG